MRKLRELPETELARRYTAGESISTLSSSYDCSPATIAKRLRALGVAIRRTRYHPISIPRDEFERMYVHECLPLRVIAERLGVAHSTVGSKRRAFGIPARSNRGRVVETARAGAWGPQAPEKNRFLLSEELRPSNLPLCRNAASAARRAAAAP